MSYNCDCPMQDVQTDWEKKKEKKKKKKMFLTRYGNLIPCTVCTGHAKLGYAILKTDVSDARWEFNPCVQYR